jgi:hypothetical protein
MKTTPPFRKHLLAPLLLLLIVNSNVKAQTSELVFNNYAIVPGTGSAGQDGTEYRFYNVTTSVDAVLKIVSRSAANVVINSIDITTDGWNKSLQPELGVNGNVGANQNWWVKFNLKFYQSGGTVPVNMSQFVITALDIDGNGGTLREWIEMDKIASVGFSQVNSLTDQLLASVLDLLNLNNSGEDHKTTGVNTAYPGIDTTATNIMASYTYINKSQITFYLGGKTGASGSSSAMRMNSLWFKQFNLAASTLPVKLTDFTAKYNKTNVELTWKSNQEINFSHYILEHSPDGINFSQTALVFGTAQDNGSAQYSYTDHSVNGRTGLIYYRLKMVDIDEKFSYSPVRVIKLGEEKKSIALTSFPNPATSEIRVTLPSSWQNKAVALELYNNNGQKLKSFKIGNSSQTETFAIADLQRGVYFIRASCGNDLAEQTILKQ